MTNTKAKKPTTDPVQNFCLNFPCHLDMTVSPSRWMVGNDRKSWPSDFEKDISLKISRYSLEVFLLVLKEDSNPHLVKAALEFYSPTSSELLCSSKLIADALIKTGLSDVAPGELEKQVAESIAIWKEKAIKKAKEISPEIEFGTVGWDPYSFSVSS